MSFDFFNTSNLAFGVKLTKAFMALESLLDEAKANIVQVQNDQSVYSEYVDRNYQVPRPTKSTAPCRTDEAFNIVNDKTIYISRLERKNSKMYVSGVIFNRTTNRITKFSGNTTKKSGYVYYKTSTSNAKPDRTLTFSSEESLTGYNFLFQFRIDNEDHINLVGEVNQLNLVPYDTSQILSMSKGSTLATNSSDYTSKDYQVVCVVGTSGKIMVYLNDKWIFGNKKSFGDGSIRNCILYLKPDDVITGTYKKIFRINYNTK